MTQSLDGARPYLTGAKPSEAGWSYALALLSRRRRLINIVAGIRSGSAIHEYVTNDVYAGRSLAQLQATTESVANFLHRRKGGSESGLWAVVDPSGSGFITFGGLPTTDAGTHPSMIGPRLAEAPLIAALPSMV